MSEYQVTATVTALRRTPEDDGAMDTQLLFGEVFLVETEEDGWAYGRSHRDNYPGWVDLAALSAPVLIATHKVSALRTYAYAEPDLKSPPVGLISMNAPLPTARRDGKFIEVQRLGWVFEAHTAAVGECAEDYVSVAELFEHTPYLWGGRESLGLDCSALLQNALERAGISGCPRDSGDQEAWCRENWERVEFNDELSGLQRGDVIFWPGHVGIMTSETHFLHANGHHMLTIHEPVSRTVMRIAHHHAPVSAICRPPRLGG